MNNFASDNQPSVMSFGDVIMVKDWQKGLGMAFECSECNNPVIVLFNKENDETILEQKFVTCESCKHQYQLIF